MHQDLYSETSHVENVSPSKQAATVWRYIDATTRPEFVTTKRIINDWFSRYNNSGRNDLKRRFQSPDNYQHFAALFELYCHELLLRHGYEVEVHRKKSGAKATRPDFQASQRGKESFYLE